MTIHAVRFCFGALQSFRQSSQYIHNNTAKDSLIAILKATGKPVDEAQVDAVLATLKGRKVDEVISKGISKVSVGAPAAPAKDEKKAEKKEEKKVEKKEEKKKEPEPAPPAEEEDFNLDLFG